MTARHDKATCTGAGDCSAEAHIHGCFADRGNCDHPSEHQGRTEAAAVDQAIADVRRALDTLTDASFQEADDAAMHEDSLNAYAALRVLADAVGELRLSLYSRDILLSLANGRLEAAEAERDRLDRCLTLETERAIKAEGEAFRLARQVADLTALLQWYDDHADGDGNYDGEMWGNLRVLDPAVARSRDPQEPQT